VARRDRDNSQRELIQEFFMLFSKFEYALKMSGFHNGNGNAKADWESFSSSIDDVFLENPSQETSEGIAYFNKKPPRKQVVTEGKLAWSDNPPNSKTKTGQLVLYVCRVRNNVFHGGKYCGHFLSVPDRSEMLIKSCIEILNHALALSHDVKEAFNGNAT
jgi:hypothetical protein